jgi:CheY-like chemotaxis protein
MAHKILLVEDDPAQARRIETIVSTFGYQVNLSHMMMLARCINPMNAAGCFVVARCYPAEILEFVE